MHPYLPKSYITIYRNCTSLFTKVVHCYLPIIVHCYLPITWMLDGILCGASSIFFSCLVCVLLLKHQHYSEIKIIIIALILPLIGEIGYWKYLNKKRGLSFVDRFHIAMKTFPKRAYFAMNWSTLSEKLIASGEITGIEDMRNEERLQKMKDEAYAITQGNLAILFLWSILGYILGLFIVHHFLF